MPEKHPEAIRQAVVSGSKNDLILLLCGVPPAVISQAVPQFKSEYGYTPARAIGSSLGGFERNFKRVIEGCAMGLLEFHVKTLNDALSSFLVKHDVLIEMLAGSTLDDLRAIRFGYNRVFGRAIDADLNRKLYGQSLELYNAILNIDRRTEFRDVDVQDDAGALYQAGEFRIGADIHMFLTILTQRSDEHLRQVFSLYQSHYKRSLERVIKSEFFANRNVKRALLALVGAARNRFEHAADGFHDALTSHNMAKLARFAIRHRDPEIRDRVKLVYLR
ncbi:hypothetical protein HDU93_008217, partial [Gonapodya sp. JEL0774]